MQGPPLQREAMVGSMAGLYDDEEQAQHYARARPTYPSSWFSRLVSLTPHHHLAWDAGTGTGQAAVALAEHYERVIATDVSERQLRFAQKRANVEYLVSPAALTEAAVDSIVGREGSVDLLTVATAAHWFDLEAFYRCAKRALRKDGGVIAVWSYSHAHVTPAVDQVLGPSHQNVLPHRDARMDYVLEEYRTLPFPFEGVLEGGVGREGNPLKFEIEKEMGIEDFLALLGSYSAVTIAKAKGAEILQEGVVHRLREAWGGAHARQTVTFPCFALVGALKPKDQWAPQ